MERFYSEKETSNLLNKAIMDTVRETMFACGEFVRLETSVVDVVTREPLPNVELVNNPDRSLYNDYVLPRLIEKGIIVEIKLDDGQEIEDVG